MTHSLEFNPKELALLPTLARQEQRQLLKVFWLVTLGLFLYEFFWAETSSSMSNFSSVLITLTALLPSYLWCSGRALGIPIFPLFAFSFIWTYALPIVNNHPKVVTHSPDSQLFAGCTVAGFLVIGTFIWFQFVKSPPDRPKFYRSINIQKGNVFFLYILVIGIFFNVNSYAGWFVIEGGLFTTVRSFILGLIALSTFALSYNLGTQKLSKNQSILFIIFLAVYMVTNTIGLLLVSSASTFLIAIIAFIIGRKKIPILLIVIVFLCFSMLHYGKAEMRSQYWGKNLSIQPWDYPSWYTEWIGYSLESLYQQNHSPVSKKETSFLERSSVIHMLLLAQTKSPDSIPFLNGKTYEILPQVIVPRILNSNKIWTHEGTYLLNIHYGLQTRQATFTTTIGWGLLAESYANFGLLGCSSLAVILGLLYGQATRWSINTPVLSDRSLFAVLIMTFGFRTEWTAGVYVSALFQASVVLCLIVVFLMKTYKTPTSPSSNYEV